MIKSTYTIGNETYILERSPLALTWGPPTQDFFSSLPQADIYLFDDIYFGKSVLKGVYNQLHWPESGEMTFKSADMRGTALICESAFKKYESRAQQDNISVTSYILAHHKALNLTLKKIEGFKRVLLQKPFHAISQKEQSPYKAKSISIICNYRDRTDLTKKAIDSLKNQELRCPTQLILVNNQSTAESLQFIKSYAQEQLAGKFEILHLDYDKPFNKSAQDNLAVSKAQGEVVVLFNNDTELVSPNVIATISDWACMPGVASAGPRIMSSSGRIVSVGVQIKPVKQKMRICESEDPILVDATRETLGNSFACAAVKRDVWNELGGMDTEQFPSQYNDADYFLNALKKGYKHIYIGSVTVIHNPGSTEAHNKARVQTIHERLMQKHPDLGKFLGDSLWVERKSIKKSSLLQRWF